MSNETGNNEKKKKGLGVVLAVVILLAGLVGGYFVLFASPKQVFSKTLGSGFDMAASYLTSVKKGNTATSLRGEMNANCEITAEDSELQKMMAVFNNLDVNMKYGVDYQEKVFDLYFSAKYKNKDLPKLDVYGENSKIYMKLENIMDNYVYSDLDEYGSIFSQDEVDVLGLVKILKGVESALKKAVSDEDIKKTSTTIKVGDIEKKVTKNYLVVDGETLIRIEKKFFTELKKDDEFVEAVADFYGYTIENVKDALNSLVESYDNQSSSYSDTYTVSVYTEGLLNSFAGFGLEVEDDDSVYAEILVIKNDSVYGFEIKGEKESLVSGTLKIDNNSGKSGSFDSELFLKISSFGTIKLNFGNSVDYNVGVDKNYVTGSVHVDDLEEEEVNNIMSKLEKDKTAIEFYNDIQDVYSSMFGSRYNYYDDYDDDDSYYSNYSYYGSDF